MDVVQSLLGMAAILALAWVASENRRAVAWRTVAIGVALTAVLAVLMLKVPPVVAAFRLANSAVEAIAAATRAAPRSRSATWAAARCRSS